MGRPALSIDIAPKDQKELAKLLSGGVQQVRVVLRALALLQLAKGTSAPQIADLIPLTSQASGILAVVTSKAVWSVHSMKDRGQRNLSMTLRHLPA
jgi:hypothetical protein